MNINHEWNEKQTVIWTKVSKYRLISCAVFLSFFSLLNSVYTNERRKKKKILKIRQEVYLKRHKFEYDFCVYRKNSKRQTNTKCATHFESSFQIVFLLMCFSNEKFGKKRAVTIKFWFLNKNWIRSFLYSIFYLAIFFSKVVICINLMQNGECGLILL